MKDALRIEQCETNIRALCAHHRISIAKVIANEANKILIAYDAGALRRVMRLVRASKFKRYFYSRNHGLTAYCNWREQVGCFTLQVVLHVVETYRPKRKPRRECVAIELDIDLCNPLYDVVMTLGHIAEVFWPGKTDPFRVMRGLRRRGLEVRDVRDA